MNEQGQRVYDQMKAGLSPERQRVAKLSISMMLTIAEIYHLPAASLDQFQVVIVRLAHALEAEYRNLNGIDFED